MKIASILSAVAVAVCTISLTAQAVPTTVSGATFALVGTRSGTQLFGLTSDATGRVYVGNNSNDTTGIPVQLFDPSLFSGTTLTLQDFGPNVGDADGMAYSNNQILVADRDEGVRAITIPTAANSVLIPNVAINPTGSPIVVRPSDNHIFVGLGGLTGVDRIDEYNASGSFLRSHATGTDVETMTFDPGSGLIYYAAFGSDIRAINPSTDADRFVGTSSGTIDGGLDFDPLSGLLFVGTANGANAGLVETILPADGTRTLFASGFNGCLGILRVPATGDLFFLENNNLYRLNSADVGTPEPGSLALSIAGAALLLRRKPRSLR